MRVPSAAGEPVALVGVVHDAGVVVEHGEVLVERARILADRFEHATGGGPRAPVDRVRVRDGVHVGPGTVDLGVDRERGAVEQAVALEHGAVEVDEDQVSRREKAPAAAERVDPEAVGMPGVAHRDVAGDPVVVAEPGEDAVRGGEPELVMGARGLDRVEDGRFERRHPNMDGGIGIPNRWWPHPP